MTRYYHRPLAEAIRESHSKVIVLEGARAVGKTSLVRQELNSMNCTYLSLADASVFKEAKEDVSSWVSRIKLPAIIDEAQRLPDLPLAVKEVVDGIGASSPLFILTGSASINKNGLDGQDPLTRRSRRFSLYPLTQAEIFGRTRNIIDDFFDETPNTSYDAAFRRNRLASMMRIGGFPSYVTTSFNMPEQERTRLIRSDLESMLGDNLLPDGRLDREIAHKLLSKLLASPGSILNVSSLSNECDVNAITVTRYMSIFLRRFLIHTLPNLASPPRKQEFTRSKVHPIDTTFSIEALKRAGAAFEDNPSLFGHIFESFVINQIIPATFWAKTQSDSFYWREPGKKPKEVDLVLLANEGMVGIEVKASSTVDSNDFVSLRALQEDSRFHRGFVIYTGAKVVQHAKNLWALPVSSLWDAEAFQATAHAAPRHRKQASTRLETTVDAPRNNDSERQVDASIFLSYRHDDDDHLEGRIVQYAKDLADEYNYQYGTSIEVFIDKETLNWGDVWPEELERRIRATNFIMPAVTPRYLLSESCRKEILSFNAKLSDMPNSRILPLLWQSIDHVAKNSESDPIIPIVTMHQWIDVSSLRYASKQDKEYRISLETTASELREVIVANVKKDQEAETTEGESGPHSPATTSNDANGILEKMVAFEHDAEALSAFGGKIAESFRDIGSLITRYPMPSNPTAKGMLVWSKAVSNAAQPHIAKLDAALKDGNLLWQRGYDLFAEYLHAIDASYPPDMANPAITKLEDNLYSLAKVSMVSPEMEQTRANFQMAATLAPSLKPLARSITSTIGFLETMGLMCEGLLDELEGIRERKAVRPTKS